MCQAQQGGTPIPTHLRRFFVEEIPEPGQRFALRGEEAHHMLSVVRIRKGENVLLLDGEGIVAEARLEEARRDEATLVVLSRETVLIEPARRLTLACAVPRSSRMDTLVEKCGELGVARLMPMVTARSVVDAMERQENHLLRWRRIGIEAAKQSGRTKLTELTAVLPFDAALRTADPGAARLIASPEPDAVGLAEFAAALSKEQAIQAFIGPEGGFTPEEVLAARGAGCVPVSLGPRILRVETAGIALAAYFLLGT